MRPLPTRKSVERGVRIGVLASHRNTAADRGWHSAVWSPGDLFSGGSCASASDLPAGANQVIVFGLSSCVPSVSFKQKAVIFITWMSVTPRFAGTLALEKSAIIWCALSPYLA